MTEPIANIKRSFVSRMAKPAISKKVYQISVPERGQLISFLFHMDVNGLQTSFVIVFDIR